MQFYQSEASYVKFDYMIPRGASIGVYARRNALPTHTQYHFLEVLSGFKARTTRASHVSNTFNNIMLHNSVIISGKEQVKFNICNNTKIFYD